MSDWVKLLTSKRIFKVLSIIPHYWSKSQQNYRWIFTLILFVTSIYFVNKFQPITSQSLKPTLTIVSILLIAASLPSMIIYYNSYSKFPMQKTAFKFAIMELLTVAEKEYFDTNYDTDRITQRVQELTGRLQQSKQPYKTGYVIPILIKNNRLFYLMQSIDSLKRNILRQQFKHNISMVLIPIIDAETGMITFELTSKNLYEPEKIEKLFRNSFSVKLTDEMPLDQYIGAISRLFFAICGQTVLDLILKNGDYALAHRVNDDSESEFKNALVEIAPILGKIENPSYSELKNMFECNFQRYRGLILVNQKQYLSGSKHIFAAIALNPYFPYHNYTQFKEAYNRRYAVEFLRLAHEIAPALEEMGELEKNDNDWYYDYSLEIGDSIEFNQTTLFTDILKDIIREAESNELNNYLEKMLLSEFCVSPGRYLIKGDVIRYIPKGDLKSDAIYVERIPEAISALEAALNEDPDFVLLESRIGILQFTNAVHIEDSQKQRELMDIAMARQLKGSEYLYRLGLLRN